MHFLIDADLPRSLKGLIERYGHEATDIRDVGLGSAKDSEVAAFAKARRCCLVTGDFGFADVRNYLPETFAGIVVLSLPRNATASLILSLLEALLREGDVVSRLEGRLAIVEPGRVRVRPPW